MLPLYRLLDRERTKLPGAHSPARNEQATRGRFENSDADNVADADIRWRAAVGKVLEADKGRAGQALFVLMQN